MNAEKIQVLLVEDNLTDKLLVEDELAHATGSIFSVVHVEQLNGALAQLKAQPFDVVLLDLSLPDSHGFETFVRLHDAATEIPIVVLSGGADGQLAVQAVQAGAQDYLVKGRLGEDVLPRSIRYAIERQRADRTLAESKERYRLLIQHSPYGYLVYCEGEIVFANAAALKLYGADRSDQLLGKSFLDFVAPEFHGLIQQRLQQAETEQSNLPIEILGLRLDGATVAVEGTSNSFTHDGRPAVQMVLNNITERRKAEAQLRLLESCVARLNDIVLITEAEPLDEPGPRILFVNDAFVRRTGYSREEVLGRSPRFLQGPKTSHAELDRVGAALRQRQPVRAEFIHYTKSGEEYWVEIDTVPIADAAGRLTHFVAVMRDFTERKRNEDRFHRMVDANAQGVMFWNTKGEITGANDAFLELVGYSREDLEAGRINWMALTPPEFVHLDKHALEELAACGVCKPYEKEYLRQDGSRVPLLIGVTTFEDNPEEGVSFTVNLTERKKLEQQILRAQRMESIGTLAGGIAHDLNNVLGPMILAVDLLRVTTTSLRDIELLDIMEQGGRRGADMVKQVLLFARGIEGQRTLISPVYLVKELAAIIRDTFPKTIHMVTDAPSGTWNTFADRTQIHQVGLNLCINARDAMPRGGRLTLTVTNRQIDAQYAAMHPGAHPGPYVVLEVTDTGDGMSPEVVKKIFEPFFTTKALGEGTGLGLSTTLAIVKSHGGFITVTSEVGQGTTFLVSLPAETGSEEPQLETHRGKLPHGRGELVLIIEDEASIRTITGQTLEAFGYRVMSASDGAEGVARYAQHAGEIAAVITDLEMPLMNGATALRVLVRINPAVKIIVASGCTAKEVEVEALTEGAKYFMAKPYTTETMLRTLSELLHPAG